MVRDVFRLAKENAPAIIFIDEIDAIATARFDAQTGADREVQRILMELLNQVCKFAVFSFILCWASERVLRGTRHKIIIYHVDGWIRPDSQCQSDNGDKSC